MWQKLNYQGRHINWTVSQRVCELITHKDFHVDDALLQSFYKVETDASLLGMPLFLGDTLGAAWENRCVELTRDVDILRVSGSQEALVIFRMSFSAPRVLHLLRYIPCADHPSLSKFDRLLKHAIQEINNCQLSGIHWIQASLPVRGIRRLTSHALPAFVASAASTLSLQSDILSGCAPSDNHFFHSYLSTGSSQFGDILTSRRLCQKTAILGPSWGEGR